jgi:hypothetical protein
VNTVNAMKQAHLRTLATQGIDVGRLLKIRGLESYEGIDREGQKIIIFRGAVLGPSWASIGFVLNQQEIQHTIIDLDKPYFVAKDSQSLRLILEQIQAVSRTSSREEVFIQDVGFLVSNLGKRFDARPIIAPAVILFLTLGVAVFGLNEPETEAADTPGQSEPLAPISCALDLEDADFRAWLEHQVSRRSAEADAQAVIQTDLGTISLELVQKLGSAQLLSGSLDCEDGRTQSLQFRTDGQPGSGLVDLGVRLDP